MADKPRVRTLAVAGGVSLAIAIPAIRALHPFGLSAAAFSAKGDAVLRAAPYAFSIWGVIYLGLIIFAGVELAAATRESPALRALAWPTALASAGCGMWILAAAFNQRSLSVAIILASAAVAIIGVWRARAVQPPPGGRQAAMAWPLAMLAGWLTIASALNILNVLAAQGVIGPSLIWSVGGVVAVLVVGGAISGRLGASPYPLPIAWGLAAVYVAEQVRSPITAYAAAGAAALLLGQAAIMTATRRSKP
jgi:hypothetical protein